MNLLCARTQDLLALDGVVGLAADAEAQAHLAGCADCQAIQQALEELDELAEALPGVVVPDALAARTVDAVQAASGGQDVAAHAFRRRGWRLGWRVAVAASVMLAVGGVVFLSAAPALLVGGQRAMRVADQEVPMDDRENWAPVPAETEAKLAPPPPAARPSAASGPTITILRGTNATRWEEGRTGERGGRRDAPDLADGDDDEGVALGEEKGAWRTSKDERRQLEMLGYLDVVKAKEGADAGGKQRADTRNERLDADDANRDMAPPHDGMPDDLSGLLSRLQVRADKVAPPSDVPIVMPGPATRFLDRISRLDGLTYLPTEGYWSNTYLPGDPAIRRLQRRVLHDRHAMVGADGTALVDTMRPLRQPFDRPGGAALATYVSTSAPAVNGPSRVLVQVGLQATERGTGRRPALKLAVVLDLRRALDGEQQERVRALLDALVQAQQPGDRVGLYVAGAQRGVTIPLGEVRYGTVKVALDTLFAASGSGLDPALTDTVQDAVRDVLGADDTEAPLGSEAVMLVTAASLDTVAGRLEGIAHRAALHGVTVSTVGVGTVADLDGLDRVALAGQGSRRVLVDKATAPTLVREELAAVSRVVARAVRLTIRLAPGVKLVEVLGSERLDPTAADRVRAAEQQVDQRLARELGIRSDRGEDTEGIQIVIPAFYSADAHVVMLDVVVPGPGPVADVKVTYKDLVKLRNGTARDSLRLQRGDTVRDPRADNVLSNRVALELAAALQDAAGAVRRGDRHGAVVRLRSVRELLLSVAAQLPEVANAADVASDLQALERLLSAVQQGDPGDAAMVSDVLMFGSYRKAGLHPFQEP